jgi:serine/threonine protein kinase
MKFGNLFKKKETVEKIDLDSRFLRQGRIGQGSMSRVWKAEDKRNQQVVALKVLDKHKTIRYESRFNPEHHKPDEGTVAESLKHPYIVNTYEHGVTVDDEQYLVMDFIDGVGLSLLTEMQNEQMRRYRLRYMIQIGHAMDYFHKKNWIHRDLCPRNILVSSDDNNIKLIDFGLVVPNTAEFRKPGNRTGTANYMAPELIKRQPTDQRLDLFSYSVTCFEMYAKRLPWDAALTLDAVVQHINKPPIPISKLIPSIDGQIAETIMKGLAINPDDRWQSASQMTTAFKEAEKRIVMARRKKVVATQTGAPPAKTQQKKEAVRPGKTADEEIDDLAALAEAEVAEAEQRKKSRQATSPASSEAEQSAVEEPRNDKSNKQHSKSAKSAKSRKAKPASD